MPDVTSNRTWKRIAVFKIDSLQVNLAPLSNGCGLTTHVLANIERKYNETPEPVGAGEQLVC
ncbi:hypothetical protein BOTCAL_0008g00470 [Botryotinia calthae]|uniref:Uncharacterized protein n=1 Tax=Botryotinia calthae TaxID=38488 RepID=A0A4Y8DJF6_9HELO|nr:hypothetical protein BOTCAL_0008g00470 [Botryotinia calthae]